jgi:N-methylhydantoinase A
LGGPAEAFRQRHRRTYGHDNRAEPLQTVSVRLTAIGETPALAMRDEPSQAANGAVRTKRPVWFRTTGVTETPVHDRRRMPSGFVAPGPAVIESLESTILVPPGWQAAMNRDGFVLLTRRPDRGFE